MPVGHWRRSGTEWENQRISERPEGQVARNPIGSLVIGSFGHSDCPVGHWRRSDICPRGRDSPPGEIRLNALSGIGGVQTKVALRTSWARELGLNALSGIGGVQTVLAAAAARWVLPFVLMPCRALEAFRRSLEEALASALGVVLMPCRALEAFRPRDWGRGVCPCRGS